METAPKPQGFAAAGLSPAILSVLDRLRFTTPTPIQEQAIPVVLSGADVIGIAQTGTGKTLAFALPILQGLQLDPQKGRALILVPTRELAVQVEESIRRIARNLSPMARTTCIIGGAPMPRQVQELRSRPQIIIATPGRLQDHLNQKTADLSGVSVLVLDEADRMLDMGFMPQVRRILESMPSRRQTMLFSATFAPEIASLAAAYLRQPQRVEVAAPGSNNSQIAQELCYVNLADKQLTLEKLLGEHSQGPVLVFSRTKHGATKLTKKLQLAGHATAEIHSNRSLSQRRQALEGFKSGRYRVLVATDVAARGIDVRGITLVVNYDLPDAAEDYVHRIGRTGRAGLEGIAISLATLDQVRDVRAIERLVGKPLPFSVHSLPEPVYQSGRSTNRPHRPDRVPLRPQYSGAGATGAQPVGFRSPGASRSRGRRSGGWNRRPSFQSAG